MDQKNTPEQTTQTPETAAPAAPVQAPTDTTVAEPPKNIEFTEAPTTAADASVTDTAAAEQSVKTADNVAVEPNATASQASTAAPAKPAASGPKKPIAIVVVVIVIFAVLAAAAYYAFMKSK